MAIVVPEYQSALETGGLAADISSLSEHFNMDHTAQRNRLVYGRKSFDWINPDEVDKISNYVDQELRRLYLDQWKLSNAKLDKIVVNGQCTREFHCKNVATVNWWSQIEEDPEKAKASEKQRTATSSSDVPQAESTAAHPARSFEQGMEN